MFKFIHLYFFIILPIIIGAAKKEHKIFSDIIERLRKKSTDEEHGGIIAMKKQLFQDIFTEHQKDDKLQFGYVCENPVQWEQRFEEKDLPNNRHRGKVKWANIDGSYGEHYWDLNHK
ncbi:uncharacterized protein [Bombus flavifrons]|uniref:uncharacterized protein n=1 Tax=Bombus flavifrons TaxID=103934 RepID=UPI003703B0A3